jgi:L-asparaginase II
MDTVALLAEVWRGARVESAHVGVVVVADAQGNVVASAGDPEHFAYYRSSAKPFQAVPLVESGAADAFGLTARELALSCASHAGEPHHQAEVLGLLHKIGLDERALQCGAPLPGDRGESARVILDPAARSPLQCDCSGKHAGILATCQHLGELIDDYVSLDHPAQQRILAVMADVLDVPTEEIVIATDGCSLPTFGSTMRSFARSWAVLADPTRATGPAAKHAAALTRLRDAMMAVPENVAGERKLVTDLMRAGKGSIVAKSGAEGLLCLGLPERGLGVAIRVWDGSFRSHPMLALSVLQQLAALTPGVAAVIRAAYSPVISNHNGRPVGEIRPVLQLV